MGNQTTRGASELAAFDGPCQEELVPEPRLAQRRVTPVVFTLSLQGWDNNAPFSIRQGNSRAPNGTTKCAAA